ncbi:dihydrolipoyllysine-residue succinyltransferase component of 2-oxoglutarate dehydrogenase complex, mitochondrial [Acyrthosiphon pisum]|uniref:Dihydrolipoyllysine-residue succinyltransferase component of 2-oxoglutarate dehydrogenase complex, mitochondrial n=1 Tax=Acyrthosiphon pisum TaxID=7029 RepID=A0A8R1W3X1_ACYPI|nr:dihydrolipoyllysine-residue succinyltransferase component of 2-oxoglutarate dehydrogenase complex, mitochondrial [Acyrthosiphon pisum]|eukprot:XP_001944020.2 PREDICTED: dihydrolipoyllysine-residue succinyltransferase component of 2-oxoglutarate dehydrogenase complex, mitochondrial [Acyrthosiphon pisum]
MAYGMLHVVRGLPKNALKTTAAARRTAQFEVSNETRRVHRGNETACPRRRLSIVATSSISPISLSSSSNRRSFDQCRYFQTSAILWEEHVLKTPAFADSVSEGDMRWEKNVGDTVAVDEVVCEIETDKTSVPVPSPVNGIVAQRLVEDGATVKAGQDLCTITITEGGPAPAKAAPKVEATPKVEDTPKAAEPVPPVAVAAAAPVPATPPPQVSQPPPPRVAAPPAAAPKMSQQQTATVKVPPTDPTKEIAGTRSEHRVKMNRMRLRIAQRLKDAQNTNAMLTTFNEIDMSSIMDFRKTNLDTFQKKHGLKLGFMSAFLKASAYALQDQPVVNAVIEGNEIIYRDYVDISVAVATPKGLLVPVVRNVQDMNYADIEKTIAALGEKAKRGAIDVEDMDGGTFTVSNGGVFGSLMGTPIINPPQSAILGMHGIFERPIAVKGQVVIRPMMYIALTYDHRLVDGREAVLFLRKIKAAIEDPRIIVAGL